MKLQFKAFLFCSIGLFLAIAPAANAMPADYFTTPFTGTTESLGASPTVTGAPFTLSSGVVISAVAGSPWGFFRDSTGLKIQSSNATSIKFDNLPSSNKIGFNLGTISGIANGSYITGISFGNGDSWTGGSTYLIGNSSYAGFETAAPFTSATLTMNFQSLMLSQYIVDFTTAVAVPEPSTVVSGAIATAVFACAAYRKRRQIKSAKG